MSEPWPVYDIFSPILIGNYIRFETAAKCIANREAGNKDVPVAVKFKIAKEYYEQLSGSAYQAPLIGLSLSYDETDSILTVSAGDYFIGLYGNKNMRGVALEKWGDCKSLYFKFLETPEE